MQPTPFNPPGAPIPGADKKLPAGLCGILLGGLGVHKFILGYNTEGIIMLAISFATCGIGYPVMHIIGLIEGIVYLTKTDEQFVGEYVQNKKGCFKAHLRGVASLGARAFQPAQAAKRSRTGAIPSSQSLRDSSGLESLRSQ